MNCVIIFSKHFFLIEIWEKYKKFFSFGRPYVGTSIEPGENFQKLLYKNYFLLFVKIKSHEIFDARVDLKNSAEKETWEEKFKRD